MRFCLPPRQRRNPLAPPLLPFFLADYPYAARWPLAPGEHTFQAKLPYTDVASPPVRVTVQ